MTEKEKAILEVLALLFPQMDEKAKYYVLGVGEGMALMKEKKTKKECA